MASSNAGGLESTIRSDALLNASQHGGKAEPQAVLGRVLSRLPEMRSRARELIPLVNRICGEVSALAPEEQKAELAKLGLPEEEKKQKERKSLPPLPDAERYKTVVTRFAPNPDSVLHLGSTRVIVLSHDYARMYGGRFILRFEDTDPRLKKSSSKFYTYIQEDMDWLGCAPDDVAYQSDRMETYYEYAEKLIRLGGAYVCTCGREAFHSGAEAGKPCPCRGLSASEHAQRWSRMLASGYGEGEAVLRVKTDMAHPNPAVRDWPAMRIIDTARHRHPRVGSRYAVWPLYNWSAGLDDHLMGVTHIIRGKEHLTNAVRQEYFYRAFGWSYPTAIHYGRLGIEGGELSKSKIEQGVREGRYAGYDDPRLATLRALRRRGIDPEAVRKLIVQIGLKPVDIVVSWENLLAGNRQIIDGRSPRHFGVFDPVQMLVRGVPDGVVTVELPRHPEAPSMGTRRYRLETREGTAKVFVPRQELAGRTSARLMGMMNVREVEVSGGAASARFASYALEDARKEGIRALEWVPGDENAPISVVMPDASVKKGLSDAQIREERVGSTVQFERQFFARLDSKEPDLVLYFTSK
ncbi:MAG: glutamate--tRNA ligase [Nitrososphaerota archaeon]|nr:glutamate--tRNA ligase [Nitrososphaerota archaeon]